MPSMHLIRHTKNPAPESEISPSVSEILPALVATPLSPPLDR